MLFVTVPAPAFFPMNPPEVVAQQAAAFEEGGPDAAPVFQTP